MRKAVILFLFLVLISLFVAQTYRVLMLRFETGDAYPPYSSLRADPQGLKALYESLETMPGLQVERQTRDLARMSADTDTAIVMAGATISPDPLPVIEAIEGLVQTGGRLIITFSPFVAQSMAFWTSEHVPPLEEEDPLEPEDEPVAEDPVNPRPAVNDGETVDIGERWGFDYEYSRIGGSEDYDLGSTWVDRAEAPAALPQRVLWHSPLWFRDLDPAWRVIYTRVGQAVFIERALGKGSIVIASDSFFLSNEAMREAPHGELLSWLIGDNTRIVFDEAHLGVVKADSVMSLIRRYRLHFILAVLVVVGLLYLWKQSYSLVPPRDTGLEAEEQTGKDVATGLVNLLRRSVAPGELLSVCVREWQQAFPQDQRLRTQLQHEVHQILTPDPIRPTTRSEWLVRYRRLHALINERK